MTYDWLLWLYGLTLLAAICNLPTWWWLAYQAVRDHVERRFLMARLAIAVFNLGILAGVWARASQTAAEGSVKIPPIALIVGVGRDFHYRFWSNHPAIVIATSTCLLLTGEILMLAASAAALNRVGKRALGIYVFLALGALWTVIHGLTPL
jgi:hypothetical protein